MLVDNHIILDTIDKYAIDYHIVNNENKILYCVKCYDYFTKDDMDELSKDDEDYDLYAEDGYIPHLCKKCSENKEVKSIANKLYESINKSNYNIYDFISKELNIPNNKLCTCSKCKNVYTIDMGISSKNKFICHFCNDLAKNDKYKSATDYYRSLCYEKDQYDKENKSNE